MPIYFVHVANGISRSIAFECDSPTVADLIRDLEERDVVSGYRIGWRNEPTYRTIISRRGYALRRSEYTVIEEPKRPFKDDMAPLPPRMSVQRPDALRAPIDRPDRKTSQRSSLRD